MIKDNCIFCKIINREIDCAKFWENEKFIAILDINPNTKGMSLIIPKKHYDSYIFDLSDNLSKEIMSASKEVSKLLETALQVKRIALVFEGMGINHLHAKLYPLHEIENKFQEMWGTKKIFFEKYQGYITTQLGPQTKLNELKQLAEYINNKNNNY